MSSSDHEPPFVPGVPGASARREHERRKANRERATRARHPRLGGALVALQTSPAHERVWAVGASGEERVAAALAKHLNDAVVLLHDRRVPHSRANIDHLAVAPSGLWVIDAKRYKGKVTISKRLFQPAKLTIAGRDRTNLVEALAKQVALVATRAADLAPSIPVHGALCFVDADLPSFRSLEFEGYPLLYPRALAKRINAPGPVPQDELVALAHGLAEHFPPA